MLLFLVANLALAGFTAMVNLMQMMVKSAQILLIELILPIFALEKPFDIYHDAPHPHLSYLYAVGRHDERGRAFLRHPQL